MLSLNSIAALDAFLAGIAFSLSMYTRDIDFDFTLTEVTRYDTPQQTVHDAHQHTIHPPRVQLPDDALTDLASHTDAFGVLLRSWFTKHEQFLTISMHDSYSGVAHHEAWYTAKRQMAVAVSEFDDGVIEYFGAAVALYQYRIDPVIYLQRREPIVEQDRVLIMGHEKAAILVLSMRH